MSKIVVELNPKSVQKAINQLKAYKKALPLMMNELLEFACEWIIERANFYIGNADLGSLVAMQLKNAWEYEISNGKAKVTNRLNAKRMVDGKMQEVPLSAMIEFGVGTIGSWNSHPKDAEEGYKYNIGTKITGDGFWVFTQTDDAEIDIPQKYISSRTDKTVKTYGYPAVMYAYNAIVDANVDLQNPNGAFATEWRRIKERYLG